MSVMMATRQEASPRCTTLQNQPHPPMCSCLHLNSTILHISTSSTTSPFLDVPSPASRLSPTSNVESNTSLTEPVAKLHEVRPSQNHGTSLKRSTCSTDVLSVNRYPFRSLLSLLCCRLGLLFYIGALLEDFIIFSFTFVLLLCCFSHVYLYGVYWKTGVSRTYFFSNCCNDSVRMAKFLVAFFFHICVNLPLFYLMKFSDKALHITCYPIRVFTLLQRNQDHSFDPASLVRSPSYFFPNYVWKFSHCLPRSIFTTIHFLCNIPGTMLLNFYPNTSPHHTLKHFPSHHLVLDSKKNQPNPPTKKMFISSEKYDSCPKKSNVLLQTKVLFAIVCLVAPKMAIAFNLDTANLVMHVGTPGSQFGFSVAQHKDSEGTWVVVGAPEEGPPAAGVPRGGAVFRCSPSLPDRCTPLPFDTQGNHWEGGVQVDDKSGQWFGATVASNAGVLVACAPRYVWFSVRRHRREPVGRCLILPGGGGDQFQLYAPCMTGAWGYHRQGSCQAGFAATLTKNGNQLYVGAVGSWYWQGQVFQQNLLNRQDQSSTLEGPQTHDMTYLGYSAAAGRLGGRDRSQGDESPGYTRDGGGGEAGQTAGEDIVIGRPRGGQLRGQVQVFDERLTLLANITGDQLGSYFGYSVAVADLNGDGLDDIIVGAPWYTGRGSNAGNDGGWELDEGEDAGDGGGNDDLDKASGRRGYSKNILENGMVATYLQTAHHNFLFSTRVFGPVSRGHFGLAITSLGDVNRDGYQDIAVGAPRTLNRRGGTQDGATSSRTSETTASSFLRDDGSTGAVYIYLGSEDGLQEKPSQVILPRHFTTLPVRAFGWSLSGGLDLDANQYPDLAVGAQETSQAFVLRARPVVQVTSTLHFGSGSEEAERAGLDLSNEPCSLADSTGVACLPLHYCLQYHGINVPSAIDLQVILKLDTGPIIGPSRLHFLSLEGASSRSFTTKLRVGRKTCDSDWVYVAPQIQDKLSPLSAELTYSLAHSEPSSSQGPSSLLEPSAAYNGLSSSRSPETDPRFPGPRASELTDTPGRPGDVRFSRVSSRNFSSTSRGGFPYPSGSSNFPAVAYGEYNSVDQRAENDYSIRKDDERYGGGDRQAADVYRPNQYPEYPDRRSGGLYQASQDSRDLQSGGLYRPNQDPRIFPQDVSSNTIDSGRRYVRSIPNNVSNNDFTVGKKQPKILLDDIDQSSPQENLEGEFSHTFFESQDLNETIASSFRIRRQGRDEIFTADPIGRSGERDLLPILSPATLRSPHSATALIHIRNNCGKDKLCHPDLRTALRLQEESGSPQYISGSREPIHLRLTVANYGEDAYLARALVHPSLTGARFTKFEVVESPEEVTPVCTAAFLGKKRGGAAPLERISCDIGNPFPSRGRLELALLFQPNPDTLVASVLEFSASVNSSNEEVSFKRADNLASLVLPITTQAVINIRGISWPDDVLVYNKTLYGGDGTSSKSRGSSERRRIYHERDIGPPVSHVYEVTNRGPSILRRAQILLLWPSRTLLEEPLLYLTRSPSVEPQLTCLPMEDLNHLDIQMSETPIVLPSTSAITKQMDEQPRQKRSLRDGGSEQIKNGLHGDSFTGKFSTDRAPSPYNPYDSADFNELFNGDVEGINGVEVDLNLESNSTFQTDAPPQRAIIHRNHQPAVFLPYMDDPNHDVHLHQPQQFSDHFATEIRPRVSGKGSFGPEGSYDSLLTSAYSPGTSHGGRDRRDSPHSESEALSCGASNCSRMVCVVRNLEAGQHIVVRVQARLWVDTIEKLGMSEVTISSRLVVRTLPSSSSPDVANQTYDDSTQLPDWTVVQPMGGAEGDGGMVQVWSGSVSSVVRASVEQVHSSLEWIIILGSVLAGLFLLAILILILWALGFFKRRRAPQDVAESEPLRTNGFYPTTSRT